MEKYRWLPPLVLAAGALFLWPLRDRLTAERIAAWSPREAGLAAVFLLALYAVKSLNMRRDAVNDTVVADQNVRWGVGIGIRVEQGSVLNKQHGKSSLLQVVRVTANT